MTTNRPAGSPRRSIPYSVFDIAGEPALQRAIGTIGQDDGYYEYLLIHDLGAMFPLGTRRGPHIRIVSGIPDEAQNLLGQAFRTDGYTTVEETIGEFIEHAAITLVLYGTPSFEVTYLVSEAAGTLRFQIDEIPLGTVRHRKRRPTQLVPKAYAENVNRDGLGYVTLDPDRLIAFAPSRPRARQLKRFRRLLKAASNSHSQRLRLMPAYAFGMNAYDPEAHDRQVGLILLKGTKAIGWDARGLYSKELLDPYRIWRSLRFERFRVELRDVISTQLNEALSRISNEVGVQMQIAIEGGLTHRDIDRAERDLLGGHRKLVDLALLSPSAEEPT